VLDLDIGMGLGYFYDSGEDAADLLALAGFKIKFGPDREEYYVGSREVLVNERPLVDPGHLSDDLGLAL